MTKNALYFDCLIGVKLIKKDINIIKTLVEKLEDKKLIDSYFWLYQNSYVSIKFHILDINRKIEIENKIEEILKQIELKKQSDYDFEKLSYEHEKNPNGDIDKFGEEGAKIFYEFMNICCHFNLAQLKPENEIYKKLPKEFFKEKFIHSFLNSSGLNYLDEANFHLERFISNLYLAIGNKNQELINNFVNRLKELVEKYNTEFQKSQSS